MQPRKLKVAFAFFPYGGNGAAPSENPATRNWLIPTIVKAKQDPRIEDGILRRDWADTPITMCRNDAVRWAREEGADVLVMVDSDNIPDIMLGIDPTAKPFFETAFDFIYQNYEKGPHVVAAPYCGPPMSPDGSGSENVYVFLWRNFNSRNPTERFALRQFEREEAAVRTGIEPVAALPTGVIMFDLRAFDLIPHPYFTYEYKDARQCEKVSTEDVVTTRNLSMNSCIKLGYNLLHCAWDSWAGHVKPLTVGKPVIVHATNIAEALKAAVENRIESNVRRTYIHDANLPVHPDDVNGPTRIENVQPAVAAIDGSPLPVSETGFPCIHNTCGEDIEVLKKLVSGEAYDTQYATRPIRIVELGSWAGLSAKAMAEAVEGIADYEIHCVDNWKGGNSAQRKVAAACDVFAEFQHNVGERFGKTVFAHTADTAAYAEEWIKSDRGEVDIVFVDADHSYEGCLADIKAWMPIVRKGGIICGHDYSSAFNGVKRAVHDVFGWDVVGVQGTVWMVRRALELGNAVQELTKGTKAKRGPRQKAVTGIASGRNRLQRTAHERNGSSHRGRGASRIGGEDRSGADQE